MEGRLPDWVTEGKGTGKFLAWLENDIGGTGIFAGKTFLNTAMGNCILIYAAHQGPKAEAGQFHEMYLCGMFRRTDYTLYEAKPVLYEAAGIPEEFVFPDKGDVQMEAEKLITAKGRTRLREDWDNLLKESGVSGKQIIPAIDREQIRMMARRYFQMGKRSEDIHYQPRFSFDSLHVPFTDLDFVSYLNDSAALTDRIAQRWLTHAFAEIAKRRIYYGCVKEEMAEMEKSGYRKKADGSEFSGTLPLEQKSA